MRQARRRLVLRAMLAAAGVSLVRANLAQGTGKPRVSEITVRRFAYELPVVDLAADGFPLMGGGIEHVRGDVVAALAYARDQHVVDVFVWPSAARQVPTRSIHRGFNVMHWADGSMQYWAVSDLERSEMARFAQLWQERATAQ